MAASEAAAVARLAAEEASHRPMTADLRCRFIGMRRLIDRAAAVAAFYACVHMALDYWH